MLDSVKNFVFVLFCGVFVLSAFRLQVERVRACAKDSDVFSSNGKGILFYFFWHIVIAPFRIPYMIFFEREKFRKKKVSSEERGLVFEGACEMSWGVFLVRYFLQFAVVYLFALGMLVTEVVRGADGDFGVKLLLNLIGLLYLFYLKWYLNSLIAVGAMAIACASFISQAQVKFISVASEIFFFALSDPYSQYLAAGYLLVFALITLVNAAFDVRDLVDTGFGL